MREGRFGWQLFDNGLGPFSLMKNQQSLESLQRTRGAQMKPGFHGGVTRRGMGPQGRAPGEGVLSLLHLFFSFF